MDIPNQSENNTNIPKNNTILKSFIVFLGNLNPLQLKKWQEKQAFLCIRENALNRVTELCHPNSYTLEEVYRELYLIIGHLYEELQAFYDNVTSRAINRIFDYSSTMFMGLCESFAIEALSEPELDINMNMAGGEET